MEKKKHRRHRISLETKIAILDRLAKGERSTDVGKHFGFVESTIRAIKKNEFSIRQSVTSGTKLSCKLSAYSRNVLIEKTEKALLVWIADLTKKKIPLDGQLIKKQALCFYEELKQLKPSICTAPYGTEFSASKGWLTGFLKRNDFHNMKISSEVVSLDKEAAKDYPDQFIKIEPGLDCPDHVFNSDETGFWRKVPTRTNIEHPENNSEVENNERDPLTAKIIQEGLQLCSSLEDHFLINDPNSERAFKFQRELRKCISGYQELHKKCQESSQSLITDFFVKAEKPSASEEVISSPDFLTIYLRDDSDFAPVHKRLKSEEK